MNARDRPARTAVRPWIKLAVAIVTALLWAGSTISRLRAKWIDNKVRRVLALGLHLWSFGFSVALVVVAVTVSAYGFAALGLAGALFFGRELRHEWRQWPRGNAPGV